MASTFVIDKSRVFVSGLFWQPLTGSQSEAKKTTKKIVTQLNAEALQQDINAAKLDVAIWRTSPALQVGLGSSVHGIKPKMLSAAAVISKGMEALSSESDFLCAVQVPIGWLYVAQREGVIFHDGDIIGNEDAIKSRLLGDMSLGNWSTVIAPEHWGIRSAISGKSFEDFLPKKNGKYDYKKWWQIESIDRYSLVNGNPLKTLFPLILITAVGFGGTYGYKSWQAKKMAIEAARLSALNIEQPIQHVKPVHPWINEAKAVPYAESCVNAILSINSLWPGNWEPQEATCVNGNLAINWKPTEYGWIDHLKSVEPKAIIAQDGSSASMNVAIALPQSSDDEIVPTDIERGYEFFSTAQKYRLTVTLTPSEVKAPPLPGQQDPAAPVNDWKELKWTTAASLLSPITIISALDGKGFRVNKIQAIFSNGLISWNMEGIQYVQP